MKCKRFSLAKRDMLLSKLLVMQLGMSQCVALNNGSMNIQQIEYYMGKIQECVELVEGSLSK